MDVTPFLIDDRNPPPEGAHLDGFAWDGTDFVIGDAGLAAFEATGRQLAWCADGRHVLTRREGARIGVGADVIGYRHLFYWAEGTAWAVSESFIDPSPAPSDLSVASFAAKRAASRAVGSPARSA